MSTIKCDHENTANYADAPVGRLVLQQRERAHVLEKFGVDYCCNGRMLLSEACDVASVDLEEIVCALAKSDAEPHNAQVTDWSGALLTDLVNHIIETHHAYLREELPWLVELLDRMIAHSHGKAADLIEVRKVLSHVQIEIHSHMIEEEQTTFSYIRRLERAKLAGQAAPRFKGGTIAELIEKLESHHPKALEEVGRLRRLVEQHDAASDVADLYRALKLGLEDLEKDLHLHLHKEANILFERAAELEAKMSQDAA